MSSLSGLAGKLNKKPLTGLQNETRCASVAVVARNGLRRLDHPDFPAFTEEGTGRFISQNEVAKGTRPLQINFDQQCWQPAGAIKLNQMLSMEPCRGAPRSGGSSAKVATRLKWIPAPVRQR
jgi:hypothetical protein